MLTETPVCSWLNGGIIAWQAGGAIVQVALFPQDVIKAGREFCRIRGGHMSAQTATIEVDQRVAVVLRALQEKAATQGVSLVTLLQPLAEPNGTSVFFERTPEERAAVFEAWANSHRITVVSPPEV